MRTTEEITSISLALSLQNVAASRIQKFWRGQVARRVSKELRWVKLFKFVRSTCASEIQRVWRGYCIRVLLRENRHRILLKWKYGGSKSSNVYIAGDFNNWRRWRMKYCPSVDEHRLSISKTLLAGETRFKFKFVVDGLWTCDGSLPMVEEADGTVNNVYYMRNPKYRIKAGSSNAVNPASDWGTCQANWPTHPGPHVSLKSTSSFRNRLPPATHVQTMSPL